MGSFGTNEIARPVTVIPIKIWLQMKSDGFKRSLLGILLAYGFCGAIFADTVSPYVEERLDDPVDWRSWSEETREALAQSGKPGLISVSHELNGLSQAMGKESFRNEEIAKRINESFFPIVVDKNAHPQLADQLAIYVWSSKQIAGWPLTVFVTPDLKPIDGGGYFPPTDGWGSQGLSSIVNALSEQWSNSREIVQKKAEEGLEELSSYYGEGSNPSESFTSAWIDVAVENLGFQFDETHGGFGLPPKALSFDAIRLLEASMASGSSFADQAEAMRRKSLPPLVEGALRDYVRGGFFAAATEATWAVPDFRKLAAVQAGAINYLYDKNEYHSLAEGAARSLVEEFRRPDGLFCEQVTLASPSFDDNTANTWTYEELGAILKSEEREALAERFGLSAEGNVSEELDVSGQFEGRNILKPVGSGSDDPLVASSLAKLREASRARFALRQESVVSVRINAIVASALLKLEEPYRQVGLQLVDQTVKTFWDGSSKRLRAAATGDQALMTEGSSKDYAWFIRMLLDAAEGHAESREKRLRLAEDVQAVLDQRFSSEQGPYWVAPTDSKVFPIPVFAFLEDGFGSANSVSISNLDRMASIYPNKGYESKRDALLNHLPEEVTYAAEQYPDLILAAFAVQR